jgi:hypothetical protein
MYTVICLLWLYIVICVCLKGGNNNNAPLNPQPTTAVDESAPANAKAMDVD